jgi:hypothetical protein
MYISADVASETINHINHIWETFNEFSENIIYFVKFAGKSHPALTMDDRREHLENCLSSIHAETTSLAQLLPSDTVSASIENTMAFINNVQQHLKTFDLQDRQWLPSGRGYEFLQDYSSGLGRAISSMVSAIVIYIQPTTPSSTKSIATDLRHLLSSIKTVESQEFAKEAIQCLEADSYKAAVVFSWIGAISVLYDYVIANRLTDFNNEAKTRDTRWKSFNQRRFS